MAANQALLTLEDEVEHGNGKKINEEITVYWYRWAMLLMFVFGGVANAMVLLTWAPITDLADTYWSGIGLTAINLLNVIFQIAYLPGTLLALRISEKYSLRMIMVGGGTLTTAGCFIRLVGALAKGSGLGSAGSYTLILLGTSLVGLAQPFYLNLPAKIAATWFAVKERDIATTLCSLANPLGSAIGSFIPAMFVSESNISGGIRVLLTVQLIVAGVAYALILMFFKAEPPTPPSESAKTMQQANANRSSNRMFREVANLYSNKEYLKLFMAFTIVLGNMNAIAALLNQLPGGYSNGQIGTTGAVMILSGFVGAFGTGFMLEYTKKYRPILKTAVCLTFLAWTFFMANCRSNNFSLFIFGGALLGLATIPTSKCYEADALL